MNGASTCEDDGWRTSAESSSDTGPAGDAGLDSGSSIPWFGLKTTGITKKWLQPGDLEDAVTDCPVPGRADLSSFGKNDQSKYMLCMMLS
jgi:hypothetical protein